MDFSSLVAAVDFSDVLTVLGSVAIVFVGVKIAVRGARIILQMLKDAANPLL